MLVLLALQRGDTELNGTFHLSTKLIYLLFVLYKL